MAEDEEKLKKIKEILSKKKCEVCGTIIADKLTPSRYMFMNIYLAKILSVCSLKCKIKKSTLKQRKYKKKLGE
jgi:hypothetical protein